MRRSDAAAWARSGAGHDELLGRPVAIKEVRFPPELGEQEQADLRQRTLREARATASLSHPNVVTTYDVVEEGGLPYIVMELLDARSLSDILREDGPLPPHRVAQIGLEMLGALELSHSKGVVHRDVKPGNVLMTKDGRAILTDFGIATMAGDPALTSTGVVLGSPAYMSPERARGLKPGPEADMWSLGATLYSAAEGRPPYDGDNALGTLTSVISDPVEPPRVGGPLAEAILGLLEKEPADRMSIPQTRSLLERAAADRSAIAAATTVAAAADLDRASRTEALPVAATAAPQARDAAPTPPPPLWRDVDDPPPGSKPRSSAWLAIALLAVLAILAGLGWAAMRDDPTDNPAASEPTTSQSTKQTAEHHATRDDGLPGDAARGRSRRLHPPRGPDRLLGRRPRRLGAGARRPARRLPRARWLTLPARRPDRRPQEGREEGLGAPGEVASRRASPTTSGSRSRPSTTATTTPPTGSSPSPATRT